MSEDPRRWVCEHGSYERWHWFRDGHYRRAVCGTRPIQDTPKVLAAPPDHYVCPVCIQAWHARPRQEFRPFPGRPLEDDERDLFWPNEFDGPMD